MSGQRDTAAAIVREAKTIIDERGEAALRVTELAERCEIAPSVLYHHFRDRDDIIAAVRVAEFTARVESSLAQINTVSLSQENFAAVVSMIVDEMSDPRNETRRQYRHERMQALVAARLNSTLQQRLTETQVQLSDRVIAMVKQAQSENLVDNTLDASAVAFLLEVIPLGTALANVYGNNLPSPDAWREVMTRLVTCLMPSSSDAVL